MFNNVFYFSNINSIGGVETFFYYLVKKYKDYDITILYRTGDANQIKRLSKYALCIKYTSGKIICKKAFFSYTIDIIDNIDAEEYIQVIHADYIQQGVKPNTHPKITRYIGVSKQVCKNFTKITGLPCELCYNPIEIDTPKKKLKLISATRLTSEKGKDRIVRLADLLDKYEIDYIWDIYTNDKSRIKNPHIRYLEPTLDITSQMVDADFLVQLSSSEAYCYSVVESLVLGKPVIITDLPIYNELGIDENNSIKLDLDFKDIDTSKLYKNYNFIYQPKEDKWDEILCKTRRNNMIKVEALDTYQRLKIDDVMLGRVPKEGEQFEVDKERLNVLLGENPYHIPFVKIVEPVKEVKKAILPKKKAVKR